MSNPIDREVAVFSAVRRLPAQERAAYLDEACAGDGELRQRVEDLLRASEEAGAFLRDPAQGARRPADAVTSPETLRKAEAPGEKAGDRIGRYKLLQQIGEGGWGVVYMAEQEEPVRRRVALKVIKLGMDTKQVIARFEAERQALALMDHPNIAKVLEAGATDTGRPYFVMELVRGDLDWIVMKALEKDRTRRYETANGLARDVERYRADEPVLARPPSNLYRFQKLVR